MDLNTIFMLNKPNLYFQARPFFWAPDSYICGWYFYLHVAQSLNLTCLKQNPCFSSTCYSLKYIPPHCNPERCHLLSCHIRIPRVTLIALFNESINKSHWFYLPKILHIHPLCSVFTATMVDKATTAASKLPSDFALASLQFLLHTPARGIISLLPSKNTSMAIHWIQNKFQAPNHGLHDTNSACLLRTSCFHPRPLCFNHSILSAPQTRQVTSASSCSLSQKCSSHSSQGSFSSFRSSSKYPANREDFLIYFVYNRASGHLYFRFLFLNSTCPKWQFAVFFF